MDAETPPLPFEAEDYLSHLAIEKGRSANTLAAYRRDIRGWVAFAPDIALGRRTKTHVVDFDRSLRGRGLAPASVNRTMTAVRGLHRWLAAEGVLETDPTADVEAGRLPRGLPKALSEEQVGMLLDAVKGDDAFARRDRVVLELLYGTGMRISELAGISIDDLDLPGALVRVTGKGDRQRLVPLGRLAAAAVERWLEPAGRLVLHPTEWKSRGDQGALLLNHRGGRLSRQGIWGVVRKHGLTAGIADRLSPHVLRHSCATHMLDNGADIRTVQELLGHASVTTTQLYTKVSTDLMLRAYASAHPRAGGRPGGVG